MAKPKYRLTDVQKWAFTRPRWMKRNLRIQRRLNAQGGLYGLTELQDMLVERVHARPVHNLMRKLWAETLFVSDPANMPSRAQIVGARAVRLTFHTTRVLP